MSRPLTSCEFRRDFRPPAALVLTFGESDLFKRCPLPYNWVNQQPDGSFPRIEIPPGGLPFRLESPSITKVIWLRRRKFVA
jgi:hypothetical protein